MMFGWALAILIYRAQIPAEDPPKPQQYSCICTYTVGCGSFKSKQIGCPCPEELP